MQVGFSYAPRGWLLCNGQQVAISQNQALFALLGTTFGGNGTSTFGIPDARGRVMVGVGQAMTGTTYNWGQVAGTEQVTMTTNQMPNHTHQAVFTPMGGPVTCTSSLQAAAVPPPQRSSETAAPAAGSLLGTAAETGGTSASPVIYAPAGTGTAVNLGGLSVSVSGGITGGSVTIGATGGNLPVPIMQPYLAVYTTICAYGIYPSRN
jgi:microcystin-dependent protein